MSQQNSYHKQYSNDTREGYSLVRTVTSSALDTARPLYATGIPTTALPTNGCTFFEVRVFSNSSTGTVTWALKAWPYDTRNEMPSGNVITRAGGIWVYSGVWTTSATSSAFADINPLTEAADAGQIYYEAAVDTTNTYIAGRQVQMYPAEGTSYAGYPKRMVIDAQAYGCIYPEITAMATATKAVIGIRRIS